MTPIPGLPVRKNGSFALLAPRAALLGLALLLIAGCAGRSPVVDRPAPDGAEEVAAIPVPVDPPDPDPAPEDIAAIPAAPAEEDDDGGPPADERPSVEEPVTESPLDRLATVTPELSPTELEQERDRVAETEPTFDIPIVLNDRVLGWVDIYSDRMRRDFGAVLSRSGRYLEQFRDIFAEAGLPRDLVYMAAVESGYKTSAYSRAHARGIFQFIAPTARRYGLRVDYWVDERADPEKSARAAAAYMTDLYEEFGDWYLALAAYNAGEGKIRRAIARSGSRDFWDIATTRWIRRETKNHVPAILAATLLSKEPAKYGFDVQVDDPIDYDTIVVEGAVDLRVLARCATAELSTLQELNPALRRNQTHPQGRTEVRVPRGTAEMTLAALDEIPPGERVLYARHHVRRGDTLSGIAGRYGVTVRDVQAANGLGRRTLIRVGQVLRVPTSAAGRYAGAGAEYAAAGGEPVTYRVRRGDTLSGIARRHGTTAGAIATASNVPLHGLLHPGQRLTVVPGVRSASAAVRVARSGSTASGEKMVHTVRRGDTLWHLASRYDTSVDTLCSLNSIRPSTVLYPGTRLTVGYK